MFRGHRHGETWKSDRWWIAAVSGGAPKPLAIPVLEQANQIQPRVYFWTRQRDGRAFITYSVQQPDTWNLWRLQVSSKGEAVAKPEQITAGAGLLDRVAPFSDDGKLVYTVSTLSEQIFNIPAGEKRGPVAELPLTEGALYYSPYASHDGRWMVYVKAEWGKRNIITLRDFATGTERVLDDKSDKPQDIRGASASISPDGSKVVFNPWCRCALSDWDCPSFLVSATGGTPDRICGNCQARGFSSDNAFVLMQKYAVGKLQNKIVAVDLATKREREFLSDSSNGLYHPFLSWDDHWVVFKKLLTMTKAQILMAPVRHGQAANETEWVAITDGRFSDDKPQVSPDGNTVYFTSDRDGYLCIWTQRLNPTTKYPVGAPTAYEHFHNSMGRDAVSYDETQAMSDLTVARNKILINLPRRKNDIWMVQVN
jgi:hypothetical protein